MVYFLFLKGLGLTVEEVQTLVTREFLKAMTHDKFDSKRYLYSIRHLYGLEGAR
eukprot:m.20025 g.20025  ORF g.20025 m.20025 type:complete len:54 (-) comp12006_c0_seq1:37-198(-)